VNAERNTGVLADVTTRLAAMPGTNRLAAFFALLAVLATLSGCGSDEINGEIPPANAQELNAALDAVSAAIASRDCDSAVSQADQFVEEVNQLPADPSAELKPELQRAGDNLQTLVSDECPATSPIDETTTTTDETTSPIDETTTTTDETTTTTTTDETTTDEQPPPGNGKPSGGNGGGPSGGGGSGGGTGGTGGGTGDQTGD
jgi:hypothetical protein